MEDSKRDTDVKNSLLDSAGEGKGGMIWGNSIETRILPYVKQITSLVQCMRQGAQGQCTGMTQRDGWDGEGGGKGVQDRGHMYTHGWFMAMYGRNQYTIVKWLAYT